jgi:hypothetical protein
MNTWTIQTRRNSSLSPLPVPYVSDGVTTVIVYVMQGPHYNTLQCLTTPRTWHPIDVAYWRIINCLVLPKSHAILDASCHSLSHRFHEVLDVPQSLKSLCENWLQATCSISEIIEQNLQADKQKISESAHIIIRMNKHYYTMYHIHMVECLIPLAYSWQFQTMLN